MLAAVIAYTAFVLILWIRYKKSKWPPEPLVGFEWPKALVRRVSAATIAIFAWIWPMSKWLLAWSKRSWKSEKTKKALKAIVSTLALGAAIVLAGLLVLLLPEIFPLSGGMPPLLDTELPEAEITSPVNFWAKTQVLLISFFAAIVLIFTLIARAGKKRKGYTAPSTEKKPGETEPGKAAPKKTQNLGFGWLRAILVLALLGSVAKFILPAITAAKAAAGKPDFTLTSTPESGYIKLPLKPEIAVVVMPSADTTALGDTTDYPPEPGEEDYYAGEEESYWTDWLVRPYNAMNSLTIAPYGLLDVEVRFADGNARRFLDFKPTTEVVIGNKRITGMRFRNNGNEPVRIEISLS